MSAGREPARRPFGTVGRGARVHDRRLRPRHFARVVEVVGCAHRDDEPHQVGAPGRPRQSQHRHQRHDAGSAADQQRRRVALPDEPARRSARGPRARHRSRRRRAGTTRSRRRGTVRRSGRSRSNRRVRTRPSTSVARCSRLRPSSGRRSADRPAAVRGSGSAKRNVFAVGVSSVIATTARSATACSPPRPAPRQSP